ncbi:MAG: hypothetical protein QOD06_2521 [Candidatus Binatota bacterium]|jgi:hypothetical protein|nr:hypothetical protein [Candidatus Binatota bacterium]
MPVDRSFRFAVTFAFALAAFGTARAADHRDAPTILTLPAQADINDVYSFTSPANANNSVIVVTVNPLSGFVSTTNFVSGIDYLIHIDNDGDAIDDLRFRVRFTNLNRQGIQKVNFRSVGVSPTVLAEGRAGRTLTLENGWKLFTGRRDDPFFFDLVGFRMGKFCTEDPEDPDSLPSNFFRGLNTNVIILELPTSELLAGERTTFGVWASTVIDDRQVDRMGRPAINTVLIASGRKDAFNAGAPRNDRRDFGAEVKANIKAGFGRTDADAESLKNALLPDILTRDTAQPDGYLNGRALADDVIDISLQVLSGDSNAKDCIVNDSTFLETFPYVAPANP